MAVYRFKFSFEDDDEIVRIIDIRSNQTLEDLHFALLASLQFDTRHNALIYISNDHWKKGQKYIFLPESKHEDALLFGAARLSSLINDPHQKLLYTYDLHHEWSFMVELVGISMKEDPARSYPFCSRAEGKPLRQYPQHKTAVPGLEDGDFDDLTKSLLSGEIAEEMTAEHIDEDDARNLEGEEGDDEDMDNEEEEGSFDEGQEDEY
jgi:hypothetical protein